MNESSDPNQVSPGTRWARRIGYTTQIGLAMEVPFTIAGSAVFAGLLGYLLDRWLHTGPWLMITLGTLGFIGGTREAILRLSKQGAGRANGNKSTTVR